MRKIPQAIEVFYRLGFLKNYHKDIKAICEEMKKILAFLSFKTKSSLQTYKQKYESLYMHSFLFEYVFILVCVCNRIH